MTSRRDPSPPLSFPLDNTLHAVERAQSHLVLGVSMRHGSPLMLLCPILLLTSVAAAQEQPARKIVTVEGVVVDESHAPIPNAEIGLSLEGATTVFVRAGNDG